MKKHLIIMTAIVAVAVLFIPSFYVSANEVVIIGPDEFNLDNYLFAKASMTTTFDVKIPKKIEISSRNEDDLKEFNIDITVSGRLSPQDIISVGIKQGDGVNDCAIQGNSVLFPSGLQYYVDKKSMDFTVASGVNDNGQTESFHFTYEGDTIPAGHYNGTILFEISSYLEEQEEYGEAGLYDGNMNMVMVYSDFCEKYDFDVETDYTRETSRLKSFDENGQILILPSNTERIGNYAFSDSYLRSIVLPDNITSIGEGAFYNCSSLQEMIIPQGIKSIESSAFENCSSLAKVVIPDSISSISSRTFYYCVTLRDVNIPSSVDVIESEAFYGCSSLHDLTVPESITFVGRKAFAGIYDLHVYYDGSEEQWNGILWDGGISNCFEWYYNVYFGKSS